MRVLAAWQEEQQYERESMGNLWVDTGFVFTQKTGRVMHIGYCFIAKKIDDTEVIYYESLEGILDYIDKTIKEKNQD